MLLPLLPMLLLACDDGAESPEADVEVAAGTLQGRVCDLGSRLWVENAVVTAGAGGEVVARTDADGRFTLTDLPGDSYFTFDIWIGDEIVSSSEIWIGAGETVVLEEPACLDAFEGDVLVITGLGGDAVVALANAGVTTVTLLDGSDPVAVSALLDSAAALAAYDLVLFEGGFVEHGVVHDIDDPSNAAVATRLQNLRDFVTGGGRLFATGVAYDVVEIGWPDRADFVGRDEVPDDGQRGDPAHVDATSGDDALTTFLGEESVRIDYAEAQWPPVIAVSDEVTVLVSGNVPYTDGTDRYSLTHVPLLYRFPVGAGDVTYATFTLSADAEGDLVEVLRYTLHTL